MLEPAHSLSLKSSGQCFDVVQVGREYLWCTNIFPRPSYSSSLDSADSIIPTIPGMLDHILKGQHARRSTFEMPPPLTSGPADIRDHHLYVAISAKAAFSGKLDDMTYAWMTEVRCLNGRILPREPHQYGDRVTEFVDHRLDALQRPVPPDPVLDRDGAAGLE